MKQITLIKYHGKRRAMVKYANGGVDLVSEKQAAKWIASGKAILTTPQAAKKQKSDTTWGGEIDADSFDDM